MGTPQHASQHTQGQRVMAHSTHTTHTSYKDTRRSFLTSGRGAGAICRLGRMPGKRAAAGTLSTLLALVLSARVRKAVEHTQQRSQLMAAAGRKDQGSVWSLG